MKTLLRISMVVLFISSLFAKSIVLPNNSVIPVKNTELLSSETLSTGQEVIFYVASDVKIKREIVIKSGTPVYGKVEESKNAQMAGISGKIIISIISTVAVDGTNILLSGQFSDAAQSEVGGTVAVGVILCPLALLNTGEDGVVPVGAQIRAMTIGSYEIVLNK